jgi:hypothetical protein
MRGRQSAGNQLFVDGSFGSSLSDARPSAGVRRPYKSKARRACVTIPPRAHDTHVVRHPLAKAAEYTIPIANLDSSQIAVGVLELMTGSKHWIKQSGRVRVRQIVVDSDLLPVLGVSTRLRTCR